MLSIQQLIKALRKLQNSGATTPVSDLVKQNAKQVVAATDKSTGPNANSKNAEGSASMTLATSTSQQSLSDIMISPRRRQPHNHHQVNECEQQLLLATNSSQTQNQQQQPYQQNQLRRHSNAHTSTSRKRSVSLDSTAIENGGVTFAAAAATEYQIVVNSLKTTQQQTANYTRALTLAPTTRSQRIHTFYQQHLQHFHTNQSLRNKQIYNAMSSLAAEPKSSQDDSTTVTTTANGQNPTTMDAKNASSGTSCKGTDQNNSSGKPCFNTGLGQIVQFMELIGNLKHTKRTGWVLRNVSDPESISGHMYRMSMMTFLLDGSEGLNQIRCMELALVHDLAESVVGDLTPFCGVSKTDKRAMELKAMEDICKLIEPRGKRIMELFEEYENGESAESKFVKDLDRLDMIMQAFEYEKRDNCLLKHQEFFDSTKGKFNHPFIRKLVDEIYTQRESLARSKGATPPPPVEVPDMDVQPTTTTNGHQHIEREAAATAEDDATVTPTSNPNSTS